MIFECYNFGEIKLKEKDMFIHFLKDHKLSDYDFSHKLFPDITDRAYWDNYKVDGIIEAAEACLDYNWPVITASAFMAFKRDGDRLAMENIHFARRQALSSLVFGELCENRGRFLEQIVNGIYAICEETFWGLSAHWHPEGRIGNIQDPRDPYIDLFAAETAENLVMAYYLLKKPLSSFCPEILDRVEYELERRIKTPYLEHNDFWWMGYERRPNNWNPWIISNLLSVFLLTEKDRTRLDVALFKMFTEIQNYYDALPEDGGCDEGPGYWSKAGANLFEFVYEIKLATDGALNLFDDEKLCGVVAYMKKVHIMGADFICVADGTADKKSGVGPIVYAFGRETGQSDIEALGSEIILADRENAHSILGTRGESYRRKIWNRDWLFEIEERALESIPHPALELISGLQLACLREGEWFLCAKGGHNKESHNHNDIGSFSLYDNGKAVLCDIGIGTYTKQTFSERRYEIPWTRSFTHNIPEINGEEQKFGREFAADMFEAKEGSVKVSFAGAYPEEAAVSSLTREYELCTGGLSFTDKFDFTTDKKLVIETLVTCLDVKIEGNSVILGNKYLITAEGGKPATEFISFEGDPKLIKPWGREGVTRIAIAFENQDEIIVKITKI